MEKQAQKNIQFSSSFLLLYLNLLSFGILMPRQSQESDSDLMHSILLLDLGHLRAVIVQKMILESNHNKNQLLFSKVYPESSI